MPPPRPNHPARQHKSALRGARVDVGQEVDAELAFHFDMTVRELMETGMTQTQARAEAARRFGNVETVTAQCEQLGRERDRKANRAELRTELRQDLSFAIRQLARARSFTAVAVLTLALGVGATAAVFSALYAVVLRPLPFANPERVVTLESVVKGETSALSPPEFAELRDHARGFEHIAVFTLGGGVTLTDGDVPELVSGSRVTHEYFSVFGVRPILGRTFDATEDTPGHDVVVLSHRFWVSHLNSDDRVIGRVMHLARASYTVIGVMPASFDLTADSDEMWTPLVITPTDIEHTGAHYLSAIARLKPGVTIAQARDQATTADRGLVARQADRLRPIADYGMNVRPFVDKFVGDYRATLFILLGAVSFVLLIACTNVANLLLSRGTSRAKELAIRAALGAGHARLLRQLLTESLVLALAGAVLGLGVAYGILRGVHAISPQGIPRLDQAAVDWRVLAFTFGLAVVCSIIFGLVPALRAAGPSVEGTLRESGRASSGGSPRDRLRGILVAAEVALAMTLLTGAGLLIRSAWLVQHVDPGFDPRGVLTARVLLPIAQYPDAPSVTRTFARIRDAAATIPGVRVAALGSVVPLSGSSMHSSVRAEGTAGPETLYQANLRIVSPGYFDVMGIPRRVGRDLTLRDDERAPEVVVINEALGHTLWPGASDMSILGRRIDAIGAKRDVPEYREVVGIVGDLHDAALSKPNDPEFYIPVAQAPPVLWPLIQQSLVVVVRATNPGIDAVTLKKPLQQAVARVDRSLPLADATTMTGYIKTSLETARFNTLLLSILGFIALVLAMVGVYGVVSYFVTQRTQEIGIRMALGATPTQIWQHVVRRGLLPIVVGVVIGFALSMLTATVLRSQLYGVNTTDPGTFGSVGVLLLVVSLVATYVPARRAMGVAPVVALNAS